MSWNNDDGLYLKYGTEKAVPSTAGEYRLDGPQHMIEVGLDLTQAGASGAVAYGTDNVSFPANAIIEKVEIVTKTAADSSGDSGVLNVGLIRRDRSTEIDFNGILDAFPQASMNAIGETTTLTDGSTYAGVLVGTTVGANPGYLSFDYDTAAFTAGYIFVRIYYRFD